MTSCLLDKSMPQGKYNVTISSKGGKVQKEQSTQKFDDKNKPFEFASKASIKYMSTNIVSTQGGVLIIRGSGFGNHMEKVEVLLDSHPCNITRMTEDMVECVFGILPATGNLTIGQKTSKGSKGVEMVEYKSPNIKRDFKLQVEEVLAEKYKVVGSRMNDDFDFKGKREMREDRVQVMQSILKSGEAGEYQFLARVFNQQEILAYITINDVKTVLFEHIFTEDEFKFQLKSNKV